MRPRFAVALALFLAAAAWAQPSESRPASRAASRPSGESFIRHVSAGGGALQTAVAEYRRDSDGALVQLVGAVHIADPEYFAALNRVLTSPDVVLYEGVTGKPTTDMTAIARLQLALGKALGLSYQKDCVVYGRPHFRRADMTIEEIEAALKARRETLLPGGPMMKAFGPMIAGLLESVAAGAEDAAAEGRPPPLAGMKKTLSRLLARGDAQSGASKAWDEVVVRERNRRACELLDEELAAGARSCAIFYGAAHLPDLDARLRNRGFVRRDLRWITAWRLGGAEPPRRDPADAPTRRVY